MAAVAPSAKSAAGKFAHRVLFMHGSGGGPLDATAKYLAQNFSATLTPQMNPSDFDESVQTQKQALQLFAPDVIVGESFGAAVAYELIRSGLWKGPTVFMCPAVQHVRAKVLGPEQASKVEFPAKLPLVIIHGKNDTHIPLEHSEQLFANSDRTCSALHLVDDDHMMRRVVEQDLLKGFLVEALESGQKHG